MRELARGLTQQLQVVHALMLRETRTRYGEHKLGYLWALIEPLLWIGTFALIFHFMGRVESDGMTTVGFLATGIMPFTLFMSSSSRGATAIGGNKGLLFYPQVRPLDLMLARLLLEAMTVAVVFVIIMGGDAFFSGSVGVDRPLEVVLGFALAAGLGGSLGLVLCALSTFSNVVERLSGPVLRPLFWISGVYFSVNNVPNELRHALLYNPLLHVVEMVRSAWYPGYEALEVNAVYPLAWLVALAFLGLTLERVARRRLEVA